jgi:hypothetical protein
MVESTVKALCPLVILHLPGTHILPQHILRVVDSHTIKENKGTWSSG